MDKKLKDGLLVILVVIILVLVGYIALRPSNTPAPQVAQNAPQTVATNNDQTVSCAAQAELVLRNEKEGKNDTVMTQRNHFNKTLNKCLVEITDIDTDNGNSFFSYSVEDAYEQKVLVSCLSSGKTPEFCLIPSNSSPTGEAVKLTADEGEAQIKDYLNN